MAVKTWRLRGSYDPNLANATHATDAKPKVRLRLKSRKKSLTKPQKPLFREADPYRPSHAFTLYVDGGCWPNDGTGRGGWGILCVEDGFESSGGKDRSTNNQMELTAVLMALRYMQENHPGERCLILADSQYAINASSVWMQGWKRRGWKTATGDPVKNRDILEQIDGLLSDVGAEFQWVPGHSGDKYNERTDQLATIGSGRTPK